MHLTAETASVVGGTSPTNWSQTYIGSHLMVVAVTQGEKAAVRGVGFLNRLQVQSKTRELTTLVDLSRLLLECAQGLDVSYVASLTVGEVLYLVVEKGGQVWIRRGDKQVIVLSEAGTASGALHAADVVFLASKGLVEQVGKEIVHKALQLTTTGSIAEALAPRIRGDEQLSSVSAVVFSVTPVSEKKQLFPQIRLVQKLRTHLRTYGNSIFQKSKSLFRTHPLIIVVMFLLLVLVGSVGYGLLGQQKKVQQQESEKILSEVEHQYDEAMSLVDLNPVRARELLADAKTKVTEELQKKPSTVIQERLQEYLDKVNSGAAFASRSYEVEPAPFFPLDLVKSSGQGSALSLNANVIAILDTVNAAIYTLALDTKSSRVVAGGAAVTSAKGVFTHGEDIYTFTNTLTKVSVTKGTLVDVIPADSEWGTISTFSVYGGSLYLLDSSKNTIWKYISTESGFSSKQNYLLYDTMIDLNGVTDMVIDGGIWIAKNDQILHLVQGKDANWNPQGLEDDLGSDLRIYTNEDSKNLYIMDLQKSRIVVFDKDGTYLAQYHWQNNLKYADFAVSEPLKKIILLSRDTIYAVDLK